MELVAQPEPLELAYSTACFPPEWREKALDSAEGGAKWCEISLAVDSVLPVPNWARLMGDNGINCWSVHAPFGRDVDLSAMDGDIRAAAMATTLRAVDIAEQLGAHVLVIHGGAEPVAARERPARLDFARAAICQVARACHDAGLLLAVEFLPRTCPGNCVDELLHFLDGIGSDMAGVCLDVNHANLGQDILANIGELGERILSLHISDNDALDEKHWLPGQGVLDWVAIVAALQRCGYRGPFLYESARDRAGGVITPQVIRNNYERLILPLLIKE